MHTVSGDNLEWYFQLCSTIFMFENAGMKMKLMVKCNTLLNIFGRFANLM